MAMMPPSVAHDTEVLEARREAERRLRELRAARNKFHAARILTTQAQTGMIRCAYPAQELAGYVRQMRDEQAEQRAVSDLRDLLTMINQREPSTEEMEAGPPDELGAIWVPVAILGAIAGGSWTLSQLFEYLAERERSLQQAIGIQPPSTGRAVARVALPLVFLTALAGGGYWFYRSRKGKAKKEAKVSTQAKTKVWKKNEAEPQVEVEEDEEE